MYVYWLTLISYDLVFLVFSSSFASYFFVKLLILSLYHLLILRLFILKLLFIKLVFIYICIIIFYNLIFFYFRHYVIFCVYSCWIFSLSPYFNIFFNSFYFLIVSNSITFSLLHSQFQLTSFRCTPNCLFFYLLYFNNFRFNLPTFKFVSIKSFELYVHFSCADYTSIQKVICVSVIYFFSSLAIYRGSYTIV